MNDDLTAELLWLTPDEATVIAGLLWRLARDQDRRFGLLAHRYQDLLVARAGSRARRDVGPAAGDQGGGEAAPRPSATAHLDLLAGRYTKVRRAFEALRAQTAAIRADAAAAHAEARAARVQAQRLRGALHLVHELVGTIGPVHLAADDARLGRVRATLRSVG